MLIGETIKKIRREQKLTQDNFAYELGCKKSYLSRVERGRLLPGGAFIKRLAELYKLDETVLILQCGRIPRQMEGALAQQILESKTQT